MMQELIETPSAPTGEDIGNGVVYHGVTVDDDGLWISYTIDHARVVYRWPYGHRHPAHVNISAEDASPPSDGTIGPLYPGVSTHTMRRLPGGHVRDVGRPHIEQWIADVARERLGEMPSFIRGEEAWEKHVAAHRLVRELGSAEPVRTMAAWLGVQDCTVSSRDIAARKRGSI